MRERYVVTLEPTPKGPPGMVKLKAAIKALLRRLGLRVVDLREDKPAGGVSDAHPPNGSFPGRRG